MALERRARVVAASIVFNIFSSEKFLEGMADDIEFFGEGCEVTDAQRKDVLFHIKKFVEPAYRKAANLLSKEGDDWAPTLFD